MSDLIQLKTCPQYFEFGGELDAAFLLFYNLDTLDLDAVGLL